MESGRIAKNAVFSILNTALAFIANLVTTILVARYLAPDLFGVLNLVQWTRVTIAALLSASLATTVTKFTAEYEGAQQSDRAIQLLRCVLLLQAGLAIPISLALGVFTPVVAAVLGQPATADYLPIAAAAVVLNTINAILGARLAGLQRFDQIGLMGLVTSFTSCTGTILIVIRSYKIDALLWLEVCLGLIQGIVGGILILRSRPISSRWYTAATSGSNAVNTGQIVRFALGLLVIQSADMVIWQRSETFFLGRYGRADQVAYYAVAYTIASATVSTLATAIAAVLLPALSQRFGADDRDAMQRIFGAATVWLALLAIPICSQVAALAGPGVILLYGTEYSPAAGALRILVLGAGLGAVATPGASLMLSLGKMSVAAWAAAPLAIVNLMLARLLIPPLGAFGAALASSTSQLMSVTVLVTYLCWRRGFRLPTQQLLRIMLAATLAGGAAYLVEALLPGWLGLGLGAAVGSTLYLIFAVLLRGITTSELNSLQWLRDRCPELLYRPLKAAWLIARGG